MLPSPPPPHHQQHNPDHPSFTPTLEQLVHALHDVDTGVVHATHQALTRIATNPACLAALLAPPVCEVLAELISSPEGVVRMRGVALVAGLLTHHGRFGGTLVLGGNWLFKA